MKNIYWTIEIITKGFDRYYEEFGKHPTASEIDNCTYLPSSRLIQNKFGGLIKLREQLGHQYSHFGKGIFRTEIANRVNIRGRDVERKLETILHGIFGEVFIHTEKIFDRSKNRVDFYVYSPSGNFGIDVFYPETMRTLQSSVNIKMKKYVNFIDELYLVIANTNIMQKDIQSYAMAKINPLPENVHLLSLETFLESINEKEYYPNPLL